MSLHISTPLVESRALSKICNKSIWLKLEAVQPVGSFKIRGIGFACERLAAQGKTRFVSSSGGNAGLAVSYAGRMLSIPVTVVVPENTSTRAILLIREQGADVIVHGASWQEANSMAQALLKEEDGFLHPFDDPDLWQGHASMIDEINAAGVRPDGIVLSVGGGGLFAGVAKGLARNGLPDVPIITAETAGAASLARSVTAGKRITLDTIDTIATSLGAKRVCERAYELATTRDVRCVEVEDRDALRAVHTFLDDHRLLVEPACGASLALAYDNHPVLAPLETIIVIVCGGAGVAEATLSQWDNSLRDYA